MITILLVLLFSLAAPLLLLIVEKLFPYPFIIEEAVKLLFVFYVCAEERLSKKNLVGYVILSGILFTFSESMFYLLNIFAMQTFPVFFQRLLYTGLLHTGTIVLMYFFLKKKRKWWILGYIFAAGIHFIYNYCIRLL